MLIEKMTELYKESPQALYDFLVNNRDSFKEYDENHFRYFYHTCQEKLYRATDLGTKHLLEMLNAYEKEGLPVIDLLLIILWFNGLNVSLSGKPLHKALLDHFSDNGNVILADKKVHEALMEEDVKRRKREYAIVHGTSVMTTTITRWTIDLGKPSINLHEYPELIKLHGFFFEKNAPAPRFCISEKMIGKLEQSELNPAHYTVYLIGDKEDSKQEFVRLIDEKKQHFKRIQKLLPIEKGNVE